MLEKLVIDNNIGKVKIPYIDTCISFEALEKIYVEILPHLKARRKAGLTEGEARV